jgi:beta-barrel assembly-enhancing protease
MLREPAIAVYLARVTQKLAQNSDADLPISIQVMDSDDVDAFTLPGGYQYISLGLLLRLESEGELASVLARGIAPTALHSATREMTREAWGQIGSIPLMFVGSGMPPTGKSADFLPLTLLSWRREDEWDADYFGVQYLYQAGYEPECFLLALQRAWADD